MGAATAADRGVRERRNDPVAALRSALRGQSGAPDVDRAAEPLISAFMDPLLRLCNQLARGAARPGLDGEDLAAHAWQKVLRYLKGPEGDRVKDEEHFGRLLMTSARNHLLDLLDQRAHQWHVELDAPLGQETSTDTRAEMLPDTRATAAELLLPQDSRYLLLIEELFTDEEAFRRKYRRGNQRHPRNYKALVLYQIGNLWREEVGAEPVRDREMAGYIRHWVELLGVPPETWRQVEVAAAEPEPPEGGSSFLLAAVNTVCGTRITGIATLSVLRHEMNRFIAAIGERSQESS